MRTLFLSIVVMMGTFSLMMTTVGTFAQSLPPDLGPEGKGLTVYKALKEFEMWTDYNKARVEARVVIDTGWVENYCDNRGKAKIAVSADSLILGVEDEAWESEVKVYPNPARGGIFNVSGIKGYTAETVDLHGRKIPMGRAMDTHSIIDEVNSGGVYYVILTETSGEKRRAIKKLIVK